MQVEMVIVVGVRKISLQVNRNYTFAGLAIINDSNSIIQPCRFWNRLLDTRSKERA